MHVKSLILLQLAAAAAAYTQGCYIAKLVSLPRNALRKLTAQIGSAEMLFGALVIDGGLGAE